MFTSKQRQSRSGIVLLIALGMLSLFSVLIVTYVVFTSHARQSAFTASQRRSENVEVKPVLDAAIQSIVVGNINPSSPAFMNDLLSDLYGVDHLNLRVAHRRITGGSGGDIDARGKLLRPVVYVNNEPKPQSTLFKFPIHLAAWHADGTDSDGDEARGEVVSPMSAADFANPAWRNLLVARNLPDYRLNDVFAGRLITFTEGPLAGVSFRVVRSFGTAPPITATPADIALTGCLVIDLSEFGSPEVEFDGNRVNLYRLANDDPNALLYSRGRDGIYGAAPIPFVAGDPSSDDLGYQILMNGVPFNGRGQNATGDARVSRINPNNPNNPGSDFVVDTHHGIELMPNRRITGTTRQGFSSEPDEPYDAADFDNWFLSWQPSDHRAILPSAAMILGLPNNAAPNVIPSYHRPEVINYLMHAPIWADDDSNGSDKDGSGNLQAAEFRQFYQLDILNNPNDALRLQTLVRRIRAAVYRPLNFAHPFFSGTNASDVNGDGYPFDGAPQFSGSNPTDILRAPIETANFGLTKDAVAELARWLINGPWDVDNDGDDVPDSLWMDFGIPNQTLANGTVVRPLIAPLIEDLDGRINLNSTGTWAHITSGRFSPNNPTTYSTNASTRPDEGYLTTNYALQFFGRGGGVGPAEINFSHLFDEYRPTDPTNSIPPLFFTQTSNPLSAALLTRYGNIMQSRYGGTHYDNKSIVLQFPVAMPGQSVGNSPQPQFSDPLSRMLFPSRRRLHEIDSSANDIPMARPMDMHGRSTVRKDRYGHSLIDQVGAAVPTPVPVAPGVVIDEVVNQPYEYSTDNPVGDDKPFSAAEFHSLIQRGTADAISRRLSDLLGDAADQNEAIDRLITFDSRSLDVVELPGGQSIVQFLIQALPLTVEQNNPGLVNEQIERMLAVELRKGSKLNLNRALSNGNNDGTNPSGGYPASLTDETYETAQASVAVVANENAFPQLANASVTTFNSQSAVRADYLPIDAAATSAAELPRLTAAELLARNLYYLMFRLILSPDVVNDVLNASDPTVELVPLFPYPDGMTTDVAFRNRYVARRLAQWSVNVVDTRDTDAIMTRLRYDPNPFDGNGFDLTAAAANVVWGMERPEIELTETIATHDRRAKRNLDTPMDPMDPSLTLDGQYPGDEDDSDPMAGPESDQELDQFRIPEASAIVELHSLRSPHLSSTPAQQENYPSELYDFSGGVPRLDLGRVAGTGANVSPVWRMAVGYTTAVDKHKRSSLWVNDAERFVTIDPGLPSPIAGVSEHAAGDANSEWSQKIRHVADVTHQVGDNSQVWLYDEDLDPATIPGHAITLSRFVWFSNLAPTAALNVVSGPSGMRMDNTFYPRDIVYPPNAPTTISPYLECDQYAVVLPRETTVLGSTRESTAVNNWAYRDSKQRFKLVENGAQTEHALRYVDLGNNRGAPNTKFEGGAYRLKPIIPIVARSLPPHQVDPSVADWNAYYANNAFDDIRVDVGFNISAPLSGPDYYTAPTHRINDGSSAAADAYPFADGYRDYVSLTGLHADVPFDEEATAPLTVNDWLSIGTYQDVASVFLQRLADPTSPWDATHNPYITVDLMSMDLTVFNGEEDHNVLIDRDGDPMTAPVPVDPHTPVYPTEIAFDTRRKIPDSSRERPLTKLIQKAPTPPADPDYPYDMANYDRYVYAQRSPLMSLQSVLRNVAADTTIAGAQRPYFNFELMSAWEGSVATNTFGPAPNATASLDTNFKFDASKHRFDEPADRFPQTLGFVNREYGEPAAAFTTFAEALNPSDPGRYVGAPIGVTYLMPTWLDRPYQSPYEIISVPATSQTRLLSEYSTGTLYDPTGTGKEMPVAFSHLLGFENNIGEFNTTDSADLTAGPAATVNGQTAAGYESLTGSRAGFEQIFDLIDTGPISFDQRRWLDPVQLQPIAVGNVTDAMFDRVTQTLRPPFNYIDRQRTPGKINLNTTPDYIRQAGGYSGQFPPSMPDFQRPLDAGESPETPQTLATPSTVSNGTQMGVIALPTNHLTGKPSDPANAAGNVLYGNGSVYRAMSWGHSTFYELDDAPGAPRTMGAPNQYERSVDSRFGLGFKSFVESRRGYPTTYVNRAGYLDPANSFNPGNLYTNFLNIDLDFRYPSRFVGMFSPAATSTLPSVQRYLRLDTRTATESMLRRTHDMSLLRPHPDFDKRLMDATNRTAIEDMTGFTLATEAPPTAGVNIPTLISVGNASGNPGSLSPEVTTLEMSMANLGFVERSQPELQKNATHLARDPFYRFQNVTRLSNLTTHHSNVFMIRMTVGYFVVDPATDALGEEFLDPRNGYLRPRGFYLIDRSIPVGYEPGQPHNAMNTVIYASEE